MNLNNELFSNRLHQAVNKAYESTTDSIVSKEIIDKILEIELLHQFNDDTDQREKIIFSLLESLIE